MISGNSSTTPQMKINRQANGRLRVPRIVQLSTIEADSPNTATRTAEKMAAASRENVCFLNRHLKAYEHFLRLTPDAENVLYLAYTISIRDEAPFTADDLRRHLAKAGIETRPNFDFVFDAEAYCLGNSDNRRQKAPEKEDAIFCLACHQFLTILDLQHIVESFDSFFAQFSNKVN